MFRFSVNPKTCYRIYSQVLEPAVNNFKVYLIFLSLTALTYCLCVVNIDIKYVN